MNTTRAFALRRQRWWPLLRKVLTTGFLLLVIGLLVWQASLVEWAEVRSAIGRIEMQALALAAGLTIVSYLLHASYDLFGRMMTEHKLPTRQVLFVGLVSYTFNLNLGAIIGGMAFRYRLYSQLGLSGGVITRVLITAIVTNWSGYALLTGVLLVTGTATLPEGWVGGGVLRLIGAAMLLVLAAALLVVWLSRRREFCVKGQPVPLPSRSLALLQWTVSALNWMTIAGVIYVLMPTDVPYVLVLGALLLAAVAGVVSHVPAGLGVIEAVFLAMLGGLAPRYELLATLVAYRAVYYLAPLPLAALAYALSEARLRRRA